MSVWLLVILLLACIAMMLVERAGVRTTLHLSFKGDVKRETQFLAQWGQSVATPLAALLVWQLESPPRRAHAALAVFGAPAMASVTCFLLKRLLGRVRPNRENAGKFLGPSFRHDNARESFPSSHSACAVALSVALAHLYPQAAVTFWALGLTTALLRYVLDAHWPSDVLGGVALGYACAYGALMAFRILQLLFDFSIVADELGRALEAAEAALRLEQAVYGLDAKDEKSLQTMLSDAIEHFEVAREVHYPSTVGRKLTHRQRCDLVLTRKGRPLQLDFAPPTLFDAPNQATAAEALWLEVKVAYQFREGGARHGGYGAQWRNAVVEDLKKMEADPLIKEAGLALVVFNESRGILEKDLELFEDVLARKEVLAGFRQVRSTAILDRIGHHVCTIALWPTIQR